MIFIQRSDKDRWMKNVGEKTAIKSSFDYSGTFPEPIVVRGLIANKQLIYKCWEDSREFYYIDTGYFGNYKNKNNPAGLKIYHRFVKNNVQHLTYKKGLPDDRLKRTGVRVCTSKGKGDHILVVVPSKKPCMFYNIDIKKWKKDTIRELKKYTDRPLRIREKKDRSYRISKPIQEDFKNCHAVVTFQSIAAVEAIMEGVPVFTTAPTAADPFSHKDLSLIEHPADLNHSDIHDWACYLSYCQFSIKEIKEKKYLA